MDPNLTANDVVMQIIVRNYFLSVNCCPSKCSFIIFTARLHVMQRTVLSRPFCLSVCLSDLFLVVVLNTQAKTAKLTTPIQQKFPQKNDFLLCLGGILTTYPYKLRPKIFIRPGGARAPSALHGYACGRRWEKGHNVRKISSPSYIWLKLIHSAVARSLCDSWASCNFYNQQ